MIPDKLYINLKILGRIQKNGKITRSYDGIIALESDSFHQCIKRFMRYDSRKQSIFEINSIINECFNILHNLLNLKHMQQKYSNTSEYLKTCEDINTLVKHLEEACLGISNLKFTYINDINIEAQLEIIIAKINNVIRDTKNILLTLISYLSNDKRKIFSNLVMNPEDSNNSNHLETSKVLEDLKDKTESEISLNNFQDCDE